MSDCHLLPNWKWTLEKNFESRRAFSESIYYEAQKAVRNKLRKYDPDALIDRCLEYLHAPVSSELQYLERHPWVVMLLIKWVLLDDQAMIPGRPAPDSIQTLALLRQVWNLASYARLPTEFDDITLFLRAIAYQQFLYQRRASPIAIGRQALYFANIGKHHYIAHEFKSITGMTLDSFLKLSQALIAAFVDSPGRRFIDASWFSTLGVGLAREAEKFLSYLRRRVRKCEICCEQPMHRFGRAKLSPEARPSFTSKVPSWSGR
jgi:hypothetical protein